MIYSHMFVYCFLHSREPNWWCNG